MMCACSAREEDQWKGELLRASKASSPLPAASDSKFLTLKMRRLGPIFGQPGTLSRRMAMQRAATVDRRTNSCQIIIKNTHSLKEVQDSPKASPASFDRSHSLLSTNRIPILAPERADRIRLEHALEGVWTRDVLPFPGMTTNRGGDFIRASKDSVMRKLSKASTASQSSKRSVSYTSIVDPSEDHDDHEDRQVGHDAIQEVVQLQTEQPITVRSWLEGYHVDVDDNEGHSLEGKVRKVSFKSARSRGNSEATIIAEERGLTDLDPRHKSRKPKTLLKAFSAEGIRTWFT